MCLLLHFANCSGKLVSPLGRVRRRSALPKEKLLARYNQHTQHWSACKEAHRNFENLAFGSDLLFTVATVTLLALTMISSSAPYSTTLSHYGRMTGQVQFFAKNNRRKIS